MQATLHDAPDSKTCAPITTSRSLGDCLVANHTLRELLSNELMQVGFDVIPNDQANELTVHLPLDHWVEVGALCVLARAGTKAVLRDKRGDLVAWIGAEKPEQCGHDMVTEADCFRIRYPWDLLQLNESVIDMLETPDIHGDVSALAQVDGILHLGKGSEILPGVYIEGNVVIGQNCRIGPNAYIRGNTSIGDRCSIGNAVEIKNSLIYPHTNIKHLSYVGDSVIGSHVNLGAGTILANYRHDGTNHRSLIDGNLIDTGRMKMGAIIGDGVRTGINTCVYPGRKIGNARMTRPNSVIDRDLLHEVNNPNGYSI